MGSISQADDHHGSRSAREEEREELEELEAGIEIWSYVLGFTKMAVVKCAVELGIPDVLDSHKGDSPITLSQLSSALGCDHPAHLFRIMRFLVHNRVFKEVPAAGDDVVGYSHTPLSRRLLARHDGKAMTDLLLLESSPVMLAPWHYLSSTVRSPENQPPPFEQAHGKSLFEYTESNPGHSKLFDGAMSCIARSTLPAVIQGCPDLMDGVKTVVDVGGGNGTAVSLLVKGFPNSIVKGINFDLPHVVSVATTEYEGVEHVGGDMFESVPKADAVFIMQVLHDWNDEECVKILKKCREAIAGRENGKLIIVEAVVDDNKEEDKIGNSQEQKLEHVRLMLDMIMMAHTTLGKERTLKEWEFLLRQAGFARVVVTPIKAVQSVIQAFP